MRKFFFVSVDPGFGRCNRWQAGKPGTPLLNPPTQKDPPCSTWTL